MLQQKIEAPRTERETAKAVATAWHCHFEKIMPGRYAVLRGPDQRHLGNCILITQDQHDTPTLALATWQGEMTIARRGGLSLVLIVSTPSGIFWRELKPAPLELAPPVDGQAPTVLVPFSTMRRVPA